ncbi:MAG: hypothetical protein WB510_10775 [Candidatus Sulfotelmatobacter sp.]
MGFVNRQYSLNALQFNNDQFADNQIKPIATVQIQAFVGHWQLDLAPKLDSAQV